MRHRIKLIVRVLMVIAALLLTILGVVMGPYALKVQRFEADVRAGFAADFYVYVSPAAKQAAERGERVTILVQPNNSGVNSDDKDVHRRDAWWMGFGRHWIADELSVVLLVPAFVRPQEDWEIYTHALDRDTFTTARHDLARIDLQLLAMIDRTRESLAQNGIASDEKILIQGFSASGMFANRFTALHPERVKAVAAGSPGGWPLAPLAQWQGERLSYPVGVSDIEALTGKPFNVDAYKAVPQLIVMGAQDNNDSLDFNDGWEKDQAATVNRLFGDSPIARWPLSQSLYHDAGANARFILVDDVGHDRKALQKYSTQFFAKLLAPQTRQRP